MAPAMSAMSVAITAITATCSLTSVIGAAFILACYTVLPLDTHFRHVLILNLATSDFLNSLNNSVAGLYILANKKGLDPGRTCIFNGLVGQITVQATDCAVLAITISTVLAITGRGPISAVSQGRWRRSQVVLVCCAIWAFPFFTGFLALGMGWYGPVTGNWCWLKAKPIYLRYLLTHGWRFLFIFVEICLYIYLNIHLRQHYRTLAFPSRYSPISTTLSEPQSTLFFSAPGTSSAMESVDTEKATSADEKGDHQGTPNASLLPRLVSQKESSVQKQQQQQHGQQQQQQARTPRITLWSIRRQTWLPQRRRQVHRGHSIESFSADAQYQAIQRALLLNAYPLAYIILLLPGLVNRLVEASGHESKVIQLLQASTQLVGLANALTYGWNERVAKQLKDRFTREN